MRMPASPSLASTMSTAERQLKQELSAFTSFLIQHGYSKEAYSPAAVERFRALSAGEQKKVLESFQNYTDLIYSASHSKVDLRQEVALLKFVLPQMGMHAKDEVLDLVEDGCIIEIYSSDMIQIYRNLEFMKVTDYTLMDLIAHPFYELFEREQEITDQLLASGQAIFSGDADVIVLKDHVPPHRIRERLSESSVEHVVTMRYLCALYSGPEARSGCLVIQTGIPYVP